MPHLSFHGKLPPVAEENYEDDDGEQEPCDNNVESIIRDKLVIMRNNDAKLHKAVMLAEFMDKWSPFDEEDRSTVGEVIDSCRSIAETIVESVRNNYGEEWVSYMELHRILQRREDLLNRAVGLGYVDEDDVVFSYFLGKQQEMAKVLGERFE